MITLNPNIRNDFPALHQTVYGKPLIYFDNAATAQKPQCVIDAVNEMNARINGNIHRAAHYLSTRCTEWYEEDRETLRNFLNAPHSYEVIFTSGATAAINLVAFSFGERFVNAGDEIIVSEVEHHSNIVPWQLLCERKAAKLKVLPVNDDGTLTIDCLPGLMTSKTRLLCVAQVSNVLGVHNPVKEIIRMAHERHVPVLIDGAQGAPHGGIDVQATDCDFYVFSGHKIYAPTGTGILYGKEKWLREMPPWQGGGDMIDTVTFKHTTYADLPLKFEAGTANYIGAHGLAAAIRYLQKTGIAAMEEYEQLLLRHLLKRFDEIEGLRMYGTAVPKIPLISFTINKVHPLDTATLLDKMGIAIRTGHLCAEPLIRRFGLTAIMRASMTFYNTIEEIDVFVEGLKKVQKMLV